MHKITYFDFFLIESNNYKIRGTSVCVKIIFEVYSII